MSTQVLGMASSHLGNVTELESDDCFHQDLRFILINRKGDSSWNMKLLN